MKTKNPDPQIASAAIYEAIDNQLRDGDPPETKQTFERLLAEGHSPAEARRLLTVVMSTEIYGILKYKRSFDLAGYVAALQRLPVLPWEQ